MDNLIQTINVLSEFTVSYGMSSIEELKNISVGDIKQNIEDYSEFLVQCKTKSEMYYYIDKLEKELLLYKYILKDLD